MCILLFQWQPESSAPLLLLSNRDEFYQRPADPARWRDDTLCGLDLAAGGTWLGINRSGRFAAVTNFREPASGAAPRSRGSLTDDFLQSDLPPEAFLEQLLSRQQEYGPFNLLVREGNQLWYMSNRGAEPKPVEPGIHGLSNGLLNERWPKVEKGKQALQEQLEDTGSLQFRLNEKNRQSLFNIMLDNEHPDPDTLPNTGVSPEMETLVSPIFIRSPQYGTRTTTFVHQHADGFELVEWPHEGDIDNQPVQHFAWE